MRHETFRIRRYKSTCRHQSNLKVSTVKLSLHTTCPVIPLCLYIPHGPTPFFARLLIRAIHLCEARPVVPLKRLHRILRRRHGFLRFVGT